MTNENTTPEIIKDIEMALKDISTVYSVGFWRDKCRHLLADCQALMEENQRLQSELYKVKYLDSILEADRDNWISDYVELQQQLHITKWRESKMVEALRWYADLKHHGHAPGRIEILHDQGQRARDTLKELGYGKSDAE
jgi:hypothetical protein